MGKKYKIEKFISSDGCVILVGRDEVSNDHLTFKLGRQNDLWFHVKGESGSHVVLQCISEQNPPSKQSQKEAAAIAAWYSKMRKGGRVPVSACRVRNVFKPKGAPPGLVNICKAKTLLIKPELPDTNI